MGRKTPPKIQGRMVAGTDGLIVILKDGDQVQTEMFERREFIVWNRDGSGTGTVSVSGRDIEFRTIVD